MFTGIVEGSGRVEDIARGDAEVRLRVGSALLGTPGRGESVAVDGVCLTVVASGPGWFEAVVSPETLSRTTIGLRSPGDEVNLERPLRLGDALGGHLVQGHVDEVGVVEWMRPEGSGARSRIGFPEDLEDLIVMKGSIAVDGISLTVAARGPRWFEVALIPETMERTGSKRWRAGTPVNLEVDILGRYVVELAKRRQAGPAEIPVTRDHLIRHGFAGRDELQ